MVTSEVEAARRGAAARTDNVEDAVVDGKVEAGTRKTAALRAAVAARNILA